MPESSSDKKALAQAKIEMRALDAEESRVLRERARLILAGETEVLQILKDARAQILATLAELPSDWQQWQLSRLLGQIEDVLAGATSQAGALFERRLQAAWELGESFVDKPLAAIGHNVALQLPMLDVLQLKRISTFGKLRLKDVGDEATRKIGRQLGLVTIGAQSPFAAVKAVQQILGNESPRRAAMIVNTNAMQCFAIAAHERLIEAAKLVPGLCKQWRRSSKRHSRWNHDMIDGQVAEPAKPFKVPNPGGGTDLMQHPHDPKAPPEQVINCGCIAKKWKKDWSVLHPGARPFTELELKDKRKAMLDAQAKAAGLRQE